MRQSESHMFPWADFGFIVIALQHALVVYIVASLQFTKWGCSTERFPLFKHRLSEKVEFLSRIISFLTGISCLDNILYRRAARV